MKNKEIEELLKNIKDKYSYEPYDTTGKVYTTISYEEGQLLLLYIEQLEKEKITKSRDFHLRFNKSLMNRVDEYKKEKEQLENNRDKAIEYVESYFIFNDKTGECYQTHTFDKDNVKKLYDILKGDSE